MENNEAVQALSKMQSQLTHAIKDASNPHFKSKYADLTSVWDTIRKPLTDNGFAITQEIELPEGGMVLKTVLRHVSGVEYSTLCPIIGGNTAQAFGSALTYARRYSIATLVGVTADDDDGNEAAEEQNKYKKDYQHANGNGHTNGKVITPVKHLLSGKELQERLRSAAEHIDALYAEKTGGEIKQVEEKLRGAIRTKLSGFGNKDSDLVVGFLESLFNVSSTTKLTQGQAETLDEFLKVRSSVDANGKQVYSSDEDAQKQFNKYIDDIVFAARKT